MLRLVREQGARWMLVMAVVEFIILMASLGIALRLRYAADLESLQLYSALIEVKSVVFGLVMVGALAALGMYQRNLRENWLGMLTRQIIGFVAGAVAVALVFYAMPTIYVGRSVVLIALAIAFPLIALGRRIYARLADVKALKRRVLVLGAGRRAEVINHRMRRRVDRRGFQIVGFKPLPGDQIAIPDEQRIESDEPLRTIAERLQINEIVTAADDRRGTLPMHCLLECKQLGVTITDLIGFFEREQGRVKLNLVDASWLVYSDGFDKTPMRRVSKRIFDFGSVFILLALSWPLMLLTALAIMLESGPSQPILYRQERVGERGRTFRLIKFRSMRTDAELDGVARWAKANDDRVTRVGRFIRKVRLDELPQLWNILRGDMSIVGPRPERPQFVAELAEKINFYELRHCVKPGLAGWAQLNYPYGADEKDAAEKLMYDLFYVKNHSFMLDLLILIQTFEVVLFRRGAR